MAFRDDPMNGPRWLLALAINRQELKVVEVSPDVLMVGMEDLKLRHRLTLENQYGENEKGNTEKLLRELAELRYRCNEVKAEKENANDLVPKKVYM